MAFLGFDIGGSQCRYEWWPQGQRNGGDGPSVQPAVHGIDATITGLAAVLRAASLEGAPEAAVCALAGVGDAATARAIETGLRAAGIVFPVALVGDVLAAAAAGLAAGPGVLVWAGTGSFAIARGTNGELHRVGGRGFLLGDQGSGYDLVRRAAAAVLLAIDDLGPPTALTDALTRAFAALAPQRLGAVLQRLAPGEVAKHLGVVLATAANGDAVANDVLQQGVDALAMLANAALRQAGLDGTSLPVGFGGGVLASTSPVAALLTQRLGTFGMQAPKFLEPRAAAVGAAWLAHGWHTRQSPQQEWVARVAI
jgi:N-acetylglucosamine kinase-like BadF-type ATPase